MKSITAYYTGLNPMQAAILTKAIDDAAAQIKDCECTIRPLVEVRETHIDTTETDLTMEELKDWNIHLKRISRAASFS